MKKMWILLMCLAFTGILSAGPGEVLYEYWDNISGSSISNLTGNAAYPDNPTGREILTRVDHNTRGDNYGARITGFILPPVSGEYTFWVAGDDQTQLWLSPSSDPAARVLIAQESTYCSYQQFDGEAERMSAPIRLYAGRAYSFMAIHKEGTGGDHISAAWQGPPGSPLAVRAIIGAPYVTTIPHAIHVATNPSPADGTLTVDPRVDLVLSWSPPTNPAPRPIIRYDVYFSTNDIAVGDPNMGLARYASVPADQALQITIPKTLLDFDVDYYWRVDTVTQATEVPSDPNFGLGLVWHFRAIPPSPIILAHPQGVRLFPGEDAVFTVVAETPVPSSPITGYQWYENGVAMPGETSDVLTIPDVTTAQHRNRYHCVVTNSGGETVSAAARLIVQGLVAHYEFEEIISLDFDHGGGSLAINDSAPFCGNSIGIIQGTANGASMLSPGVIGNAIHFDNRLGKGVNVVIGGVGVGGSEPRTIAVWAKTDPDAYYMMQDWANVFGFSHYPGFETGADNHYRSFDFNRRSSGTQYCIHVYGWQRNLIGDFRTGWRHLAATYDGQVVRWYVDGREVASTDGGGDISPEAPPATLNTMDYVVMARRGNAENWWSGMLDDARIYNYALDARAIAQLYLFGRPDAGNFVMESPTGDANGDGRVDLADLAELAAKYLDDAMVSN